MDRYRQRKRNLRRTDMLVLANDHWNFNVRGFNPGGNHGSFFRSRPIPCYFSPGGKDTARLPYQPGRRAVSLNPLSRACWTAMRRKVSLGDVLQDLLLDGEIGHRAPQLRVLFLQVLQLLGLFQLQATIFSPPAVERLLDDPGVRAGQ